MKKVCVGIAAAFSCFVIACLAVTGINKLNNHRNDNLEEILLWDIIQTILKICLLL